MINPSFPLKPVWIDEAYLFAGKAQVYREKWEIVTLERAEELLKQCPGLATNINGARFGYKGTKLINFIEHPRLAVCITADRKAAWADVHAFPAPALPAPPDLKDSGNE